MKRADLKVGEVYAQLAPSQNFEGRWVPSADWVMVLDTEPVWHETYHGWRTPDETEKVTLPDGTTVEAIAYVKRLGPEYADKRSVKVLKRHSWGSGDRETRYQTALAPLSQLRMTWAEYERESRKVKARRERMYAAQRKADRERKEREERARTKRDKLSAMLEETRLSARILEGQVVLVGTFEDLETIASWASEVAHFKTYQE